MRLPRLLMCLNSLKRCLMVSILSLANEAAPYLVVSVIRALVNRDAKYVPQWPAWVLGVLMVLYFIF